MKQKRALATGLSLLLGALAGVIVGVNEQGVSPSRSDAATAAEPRTRTLEGATAATPETQAPAASALDTAVPAAPILADASAEAPSSAAPPATSAATEPAPPSPAFDLSAPVDKAELLAVETRCTRSVPEDCERAARALNEGTIVARDAARAKMLNRIALTVYVKQCESDRALACARLAEMHDTGEIVQKNPANAKALRDRFRELCDKKPNQTGCTASSG